MPNRANDEMRVTPEALNRIIRRIVEVAQPDRIILFGSTARDERGSNSDLGFLVVKSGHFHRGHLTEEIHMKLFGVEHPVDEPEDLAGWVVPVSPTPAEALPVRPGINVVGRMRVVEIDLQYSTVARKHARILANKDAPGMAFRVTIEPIRPHEVYVNGQRINGELALVDGDVLQIGEVRLVFCGRAV